MSSRPLVLTSPVQFKVPVVVSGPVVTELHTTFRVSSTNLVVPTVILEEDRFEAVRFEPITLAMEVVEPVTDPPYPTVMRLDAMVPVEKVWAEMAFAERGPVT